MQTDFHNKESGGVLHLTTAEYLLGNSKVKVDGVGITPDIVIKNPENFDPSDISQDLQLRKAIEVLSAGQKSPH